MLKEIEQLGINKDDIDWGVSQDRWACVIVRAVQRAIPEAKFVRADTQVIAYSVGSHRYEHPTPEIAVKKIIQPLDEHREVKPITIPLPPATMKQIKPLTEEAKQQLRKIDRNRTSKEKREKREKQNTRSHNRFCEIPE